MSNKYRAPAAPQHLPPAVFYINIKMCRACKYLSVCIVLFCRIRSTMRGIKGVFCAFFRKFA